MRTTKTQSPVFCRGCPLYRDAGHSTTYVPTLVEYNQLREDGSPHVDVLVVGEAPSRTEDNYGLPFAGVPQKEIHDAFERVGIRDYALANVIRCRPTDSEGKLRPPTVEETSACKNYIQQDIKDLDPKVIVYAGSQGLQILSPNSAWQGKSAGALKGQIYQKDGRTHLVTIHPSLYLRTKSGPERRRFLRHIEAVGPLLTGKQTKWSKKGQVVLLDTLEKVDEAVRFFLEDCTKPVAFDSETQNLNHVARNKCATLQLSADSDLAYVFPIDHWDSPFKSKEERSHVKKALKKLFSSSSVKFPFWIAHNSQFDISVVTRLLRLKELAKPVIDTQFLAYLQDENQAGDGDGGAAFNPLRLKELARELLGFYLYDTELSDAMAARHGARGGSLWDLSLDRLAEYGGTDAYVTFRLFYFYKRWLDKQGYDTALKFALRWYGRVGTLLADMSKNGFPLDTNQLEFLVSDESPIRARLDAIPKSINATPEAKLANDTLLGDDARTRGMRPIFGKKPWVFNVDKKLHRIALFVDSCDLSPLDYGKDKKARVNKEYFEEYKDHPLVSLYQEYSGLYKLNSSYLNSVSDLIESKPDNAADGRIHAGFHVIRTVTGRGSSSNPNLQQLPKGDPWTAKAAIRSMYGASPGHFLLECDYGQAEVRWWAQMAGDMAYAQLFHDMKALREQYQKTGDKELGARVKNECDIHKKVASIMFRKLLSEVTKDDRKKAKSLCFGAIYGQATSTLASLLGISVQDAQDLQDAFLLEFPDAANWLTDIEISALRLGHTITPMGRRRHLRDLFDEDPGAAKRRARNSPIQAVSSDTTFLAAWRIKKWADDHNRPYKVINCVHDAITLEVPLDYGMLQEAVWLFKEMMVETIPDFLKEEFGVNMIVPMEIDFDIGVRWGHMLNYDLVESKLPALFEKCSTWDSQLKDGIPWHVIVDQTPEFAESKKV